MRRRIELPTYLPTIRAGLLTAAVSLVGACQIFLVLDVPSDRSGADATSNDGASEGAVVPGDGGVDGPVTCDADIQKDPKHCGRCGHDCLGGDCREGRCAPFPIASALISPWYIASDATHLYVNSHTNDAPVYRIDKSTLKVDEIATAQSDAFDIAVGANGPCWSFNDSRTGINCRLNGSSNVTTWGSGVPLNITELTFAADALWATGFSADAVYVFPTSVAEATRLSLPAGSQPEGLVSDGTYVYVGKGAPSGIARISVMNPDAGVEPDFRGTDRRPRRLALGKDDWVYWIAFDNVVGRVSKSSQQSEAKVVSGSNEVGGIAVDESAVYFANYEERAIRRIGIVGSFTSASVDDLHVHDDKDTHPIDVAVDDVAIYWTERDGNGIGRVWRLAK